MRTLNLYEGRTLNLYEGRTLNLYEGKQWKMLLNNIFKATAQIPSHSLQCYTSEKEFNKILF